MEHEKIDFVIPWVDGSDPVWQKERNKYLGTIEDDSDQDCREIRYRDWGWLKYLFRGIEAYAPWVNKVHFVTCGHLPDWLNPECAKLNLVKHTDYIPDSYLPTFSCDCILLNAHRIPGLAEQFVLFNDDMFLLRAMKSEEFFKNGLARDFAILCPMNSGVGKYAERPHYVDAANAFYINREFNIHSVVKNNFTKWINPLYGTDLLRTILMLPYPYFTNVMTRHFPISFTKSTYEKAWERYGEVFDDVCKLKFRGSTDVTEWLIREMRLCDGEFVPKKPERRGNFTCSMENLDMISGIIRAQKNKMICLNDSPEVKTIEDFERIADVIGCAFKDIFPQKSSFEV